MTVECILNIAEPDGSTAVCEIHARFAVRIRRTDERSHECHVSVTVVGHGLDDCSVSYRDKTFVSSVSGLAVGPTLHPVVCRLEILSPECHLNAQLVREHHLNA